jgi:hypothetical protein
MRIRGFILVALMLINSVANGAARNNEIDFKLIGACGQKLADEAFSGNAAYYAQGPEVRIVDRGNPAALRQVGSLIFDAIVYQLEIRGAALYVVTNSDDGCKLHILDIANPLHPQRTRVITFQHEAGIFLRIYDSVMWIEAGSHHFMICAAYDISNPLRPIPYELDETEDTGHICYRGGESRIEISDESTSEPVKLATISLDGQVCDTLVYRKTLYVYSTNETTSCLSIFDVSQPRKPVKKGMFRSEGGMDSQLQSGELIRTGNFIWLWSGKRYPWLEAVYDISNPWFPLEVSEVSWPWGIDNPTYPWNFSAASKFSPPRAWLMDLGLIADMQVEGHLAYLADQDFGLRVLNIDDPTQCRLLGNLKLDGETNHVIQTHNTVWLANSLGAIYAVDVSNPTSPTLCGTITLPSSANALTLAGSTLFAAVDSGLVVIDIERPKSPQIISTYRTPEKCRDAIVVGHYVYLATTVIQRLDISDRKRPVKIGNELNAGIDVCHLLQGKACLIACSDFAQSFTEPDDVEAIKWARINISDPVALQLGSTVSECEGKRLTVGGRLVAVADCMRSGAYGFYTVGTISLFDAPQAERTKPIAALKPPGGVGPVFFSGDYLFASSPEGGLLLYRRTAGIQ